MSVMLDRGIHHTLAQIDRNQTAMVGTLGRISTGRRVGRAADDAAGRAVAVNLKTIDIAIRRAMKNVNDGLSISQTAEAGTSNTVDLLQRMRELAVQSSSETLESSGRTSLELEYGELLDEIDRVASSTDFNDLPLTDGSLDEIIVQVGTGRSASNRITIHLPDLRTSQLGVDTTSVGTVGDARSAMSAIDGALDVTNASRALLGAVHNRLVVALHHAENYVSAIGSARSNIEDADMGFETAQLSMQRIRQSGGLSALAGGLRSLETSRSLLSQPFGGGAASGGGPGAVTPSQVPAYEKGDFPEDLIPP